MIKPSIHLEVRNAQFDQFSFVDKSTGRTIAGTRYKVAAEAADETGMLQVTLIVPLPADAKPSDAVPPILKRGAKVVASLESWEIEKSVGKARVAGIAALTPVK